MKNLFVGWSEIQTLNVPHTMKSMISHCVLHQKFVRKFRNDESQVACQDDAIEHRPIRVVNGEPLPSHLFEFWVAFG